MRYSYWSKKFYVYLTLLCSCIEFLDCFCVQNSSVYVSLGLQRTLVGYAWIRYFAFSLVFKWKYLLVAFVLFFCKMGSYVLELVSKCSQRINSCEKVLIPPARCQMSVILSRPLWVNHSLPLMFLYCCKQ